MSEDDDLTARRASTLHDMGAESQDIDTQNDVSEDRAFMQGGSGRENEEVGQEIREEGISLNPFLDEFPDRPSNQLPGPRVRFSTDADHTSPLSEEPPHFTTLARGSHGLTVDTAAAQRHSVPLTWSPRDGDGISATRTNTPFSARIAILAMPSFRRRNNHSLQKSSPAKEIHPQFGDDGVSIELGHTRRSYSSDSTRLKTASSEIENATRCAGPADDDEDALYMDPSTPLRTGGPWASSSERRSRLRVPQAALISRLAASVDTIRKSILGIQDIPPSENGRQIVLDANRTAALIDERTGKHYTGNTIRSSRYSLWSFFPRQLVAQFSKLANFYFLVVAILQMIPGLSTTGTFTTIVPLTIFVGISMAKEGIDDWRRYRLDKEENNRLAPILRPGCGSQIPLENDSDSMMKYASSWTVVKWRDIRVGNIIKLERDQPVPADIVLLHASGPNGVAYIETMALDGETNLKSKRPCQLVAKACATVEDIIHQNSIHFVVEDPNIDLYKLEGYINVGAQKLPLTNNEIVYRGSILRNTEKAIGMVIYTGEECKIRMNANKNPRIKFPALQSQVNRVVILIVTFVILLALGCTLAYGIWSEKVEERSWYLKKATVNLGPIFTSFLIMFNTLIPISLYVSLEIVKISQMLLMNDIDLYDEESDTPLEAQTSTINEELGQVSYIFSDKTGTLTNNSMRFRKMSVAGSTWIHDTDLREEAEREGDRQKLIHKKRSIKGKKPIRRNSHTEDIDRVSLDIPNTPSGVHATDHIARAASSRQGRPRYGRNTSDMLAYIRRKPHTLFARQVKFFILSVALCHTCLLERDKYGEISFQASSPDELALVKAAQELGYLVIDRQPNTLTVRTYLSGTNEDFIDGVYEVLDVIEFSSLRKRMSIIIRMPDQRICLISKGADSVIRKLLRRTSLAQEKVLEVERKASKRKTTEAIEVMRRNSEHRTPVSLARSLSNGSGKRRTSLRKSIDHWLRDRETDGGVLARDNDNEHDNPPSSAQWTRQPGEFSDLGYSFQEDPNDLINDSVVANERAVFKRCFQDLNDFATEGLRTLLYGYRFIDEDTYRDWKNAYHEAATSLVDRQAKTEEIGERIEAGLELIGATAIEDRLQKGVPEAIDKLRRANIKLWMLTGDKRETAINIGHSCRLVKDYSTVVILDHETGGIEQPIMALSAGIKRGEVPHSVVVIDGQTLSIVEADEALTTRFFDLAVLVDSVICCRASPQQKAFLVRSIRKKVDRSITLAIGDGANDIAMIQEAHVGIGITGKEGLQAARTSDYSIAQFRFLLKLLLVHGRWNYIRVCKYTLGTFWKETLFYLTQALYQRWNGYSGTSLYEPWSLSMFNTLFTSLPVIFLGIFEKDLAASTLLAVPELYNKGQRHKGFNIKVYLGWTFMAVCEAVIVYFSVAGLYGKALINADNTIFPLGLLTFTSCVVIINMKLQLLEIHNRSIMSLIAILLSIGGWFLWNILLSGRYSDSQGKGIYDVRNNFLRRTGQNLSFWVVLLLIIAAVALLEIAVTAIRISLFPADVDIFQELEQDREIRKRFEEAAASELQQGWDRGTKKSSFELVREETELAAKQARAEESPRQHEGMSKMDLGSVRVEEVELGDYTSTSGVADEEETSTVSSQYLSHEVHGPSTGLVL